MRSRAGSSRHKQRHGVPQVEVRPITKRILHVTECFDSGTGRAIISRVLATPHIEHHLLWAGAEPPDDKVPWASTRRMPAGLVRRVVAVRAAVAAVQPDFVHAHSSWAGVYARAVPAGRPVIYEAHCFKFDDPALSPLRRSLIYGAEKILARRTLRIGVLSPHETAMVRKFDCDAEIIEIPNISSFMPEREPLKGDQPRRPLVSMLGRIAPQKDPSFYIDVADRVRAQIADVEFCWIGDGDRSLRAELEARDIFVTGWISSDEVRARLRNSTLYVHSAAYEGFPLSILDAAACDVPVVARAIPALAHTALVTGADAAQVADRAVGVLTDEQHRGVAQEATRALLATMDPEALSRALRKLYEPDQLARELS